jgi:hypothetical protein
MTCTRSMPAWSPCALFDSVNAAHSYLFAVDFDVETIFATDDEGCFSRFHSYQSFDARADRMVANILE